jgi:hypothetical protein
VGLMITTDQLVRACRIIHAKAMRSGFSPVDQPPATPPALLVLCRPPGGPLTPELVPIPRETWAGVPYEVLAALSPTQPIPDFVALVFTFEARFVEGTGDEEIGKIMRMAEFRQLIRHERAVNTRITLGTTAGEVWCQLHEREHPGGVEILSDETAETNPEHYRSYRSSAVMVALVNLAIRIDAHV